jgi:DNA-binding CsgD family transcriptional regulator
MTLSVDHRNSADPDSRGEPSRPQLHQAQRAGDSEPAPSSMPPSSADAGRLTRRERDVLVHLLAGESYKSIGALLGLSSHTIHDHVKNIFRRLRVANRGELQAHFREPNAPPPDRGSPSSLRPREREVLEHLLGGEAYKTIAIRMGISVHTVHDYVKAIFKEFGVSSKSELLARFNRAPAA